MTVDNDLIRRWMRTNGWTQQALADRLGYARASVSRALAHETAPAQFWSRFSQAFPQAAAEMLLASRDQERG